MTESLEPVVENSSSASERKQETRDVGRRIGSSLEEYLRTLDTLRDFIVVVAPLVADLDKQSLQVPAIVGSMTGISEEERALVAKFLAEARRTAKEIKKVEGAVSGEEGATKVAELKEAGAARLRDKLGILRQKDELPMILLIQSLGRSLIRPPRLALLLRSVVTMAVGSFEVLLSALLVEHFKIHPEALGQEKEFSLVELAGLENLDEAIEAGIYRRVDQQMREGLERWRRWFKDNMKTELRELCLDWNDTRELFERRNAILHHAAHVSHQYIAKTKDISPAPELGAPLHVNREYGLAALDQLTVLGVLITAHVWKKLGGKPKEVTAELISIAYDFMHEGRWAVVKAISEAGASWPRSPEDVRWRNRCNAWLASKHLHGLEAIRQDVESWDTSALVPVFGLVKEVLLENFATALGVIPVALASESLTKRDLDTWPILAELRAQPNYEEAVQHIVAEQETNK